MLPVFKSALASDPWANVSHEVGVHPVDDAGIDFSHRFKLT